MFNVLIMSDIHIGVYRTYNQDDFRLKQFIKLKNVVNQVITSNNIKEVWIAGDLLLTAQSSPQVMSIVKAFLKNIANLVKLRVILGNHDVMVRSDKTDIIDYIDYTLITLMDSIDNLEIYTDSVETINGKTVHFRSWSPLDFKKADADYLVCHGDCHKTLSPFSEKYIDCTGYKKVFCGHIHVYKEIDNIISLGTPLMHSFSDSPDVGLLVYDLDTDNYTRISTKGMFLEFKYAETEEEAKKLDESTKEANQDAIIRVKEEIPEDAIKDISITDLSIDPRNAIKEFTNNLSEESVKVINSVVMSGDVDIEVPDLKVDFKLLKCENFLSIKKLQLDFSAFSNLTIIKGDIGAGKSTLFNLIEFMLFGRLSGYNKSDFVSIYSDKFKGSLELSYKGSQYVIERTLSSLQYSKDGKAVESNKKADLQKDLEDELSFLKFWNLIYIKQSSTGIFSDMSDTNRVSFLSNLIGLNAIKTWTSRLDTCIKDRSESIKADSDKKIQLSTNISALKEYNNLNSHHNVYINIDDLNNRSVELQNSLATLNNEKNNNLALILKYNNEIRSNKLKLDNAYNTVNNINDTLIKVEDLKRTVKDLESTNLKFKELPDINQVYRDISVIDSKLLETTSKLNLCKEKLKNLKNHPDTCPTCKQPWHIDNIEEKIQILSNGVVELTKVTEELTKSKELANSKIFVYKDLVNENSKINETLQTINSNKRLIEEKQKTIKAQLNSICDILDIRVDTDVKVLGVKLPGEDDIKNIVETLKNTNIDIDVKIQNITQDIYALNQEIGTARINNEIYQNILNNTDKINQLNKEVDEISKRIDKDSKIIDELSRFNSKVLSDKGLLVASLLQKVSNYLNTDENLKVETVHELQNGTLKPTLNIKLFVKEYNKYVDYGLLSGGQRLQADLRFLKGITNTLGSVSVMLMDETFKYFSTDAVYAGLDIIDEMHVNKVFLILHGMDNEILSKNIINVKLTDKGSIFDVKIGNM